MRQLQATGRQAARKCLQAQGAEQCLGPIGAARCPLYTDSSKMSWQMYAVSAVAKDVKAIMHRCHQGDAAAAMPAALLIDRKAAGRTGGLTYIWQGCSVACLCKGHSMLMHRSCFTVLASRCKITCMNRSSKAVLTRRFSKLHHRELYS